MRKFRIFMALAMLAGMFACQNELEQEVTIPEVEKPDVYAENGYLVFKDHQTMDSVCKVLNEMPKVEFEAWEKSMGYRSARSLASKYATEYDKINSEQYWLRFKQNYGNDLKISDTDQMVDVQFPYESEAWSSVLNEDGLFKVGHSIIVCEEGKTISILDGDESKISLSRNLNVDDVDKRILVHNYKMNSMKSDPLDYTHGWLYDWPTYIDGKYGLETRLEYRQYTYLTGQPGQNTYRYDLVTDYYIWQKSTYKSWFGWIRKKTIFGIDDIEVYTNEAGYGAIILNCIQTTIRIMPIFVFYNL